MSRSHALRFVILGMLTGAVAAGPARSADIIYPTADGTLVDGGVYGPFDGVPDAWDWAFDETGFDGAITLTTENPDSSLEHRVVWEYDLGSVGTVPPASAILTLTLRGAPVYPMPDAEVHVYAYPADLVEGPEDFYLRPAVFMGSFIIAPFQAPTEYQLDVSSVVNEALTTGTDRVAFRFQINPDTSYDRNQAFIDALDDEPYTKPYLTIDVAPVPGDLDGDGDADLDDFALFADCMQGPDIAPQAGCTVADLEGDGDVDLADFSLLQSVLTGGAR